MSDLLYDTAIGYGNMENKGYNIVAGRKKKAHNIQIRFPLEAFFHLAGLQHLTDITFPSTNKERIYKEIINGNITYDYIKNSVFFKKYNIDERLFNMNRIEEMLDSCFFLFLINHSEYITYTTIYADYLCEYTLPENKFDTLYLFSVKISTSKIKNECVGCSFFKKH